MIQGLFKRSTGSVLLIVLIAATGAFVAGKLPVMMYPQTQRPQVTVRINHAGLSALDFQRSYADAIETRLLAIEGLELLSSTYGSDASSYDLLFAWSVKSDEAKAHTESTMYAVNSSLPEDLRDSWQIRYRQGENAGFLVLGVLSESVNPERLHAMLESGVAGDLAKVRDAEDISLYNVEELRADVVLNQYAMLSYGVTINDVNAALQTGFAPAPLGRLEEGDRRFSVRHLKKSSGLEDLFGLQVTNSGFSSVSLEDIADISIHYAIPREVFLVGSRPAIQFTATPVEGGNLTRMSADILGIMESARTDGRLPADAEFVFYVDPAKYIKRSIDAVSQAAILGGILAVIIVFLILGELRNTLIIALSLPVSILMTFILMYAFKMSLNLISLGGLALAVGMVVDATIVVTENIHRWRFEASSPITRGSWPEIVIKATAEVRSPVIASTLTSVMVFLPISFTAPLANAILGDQARTVVFSLLCSLLVSLTVVPMIAWLIFSTPRQMARAHEAPRGLGRFSAGAMEFLTNLYRRALRGLLKRKGAALAFLGAAFACLGLCIAFVLPSLPKELLSTPKSDRVVLFFQRDDVTETVAAMEDLLPEVQRRLDACLSGIEYKTFASLRGRMNQVFIDLQKASLNDEVQRRLSKEFVSEGGWYYNVMSWDPAALPLPMTFSLQASVHGPDASRKVEILDAMQRTISQSGIFRRSFTRPSASVSDELILETREETAGSVPGWTEQNLLSLTRRALSGTSSMTLEQGGVEVEVRAEYPEDIVDSREKLADFLVPSGSSFVPLKHFFDFRSQKGVSQIYAEDGELVYRLYAMLGPGSTDAQMAQARQKAEKLLAEEVKLPEGYSVSFDNPRVEMDNALASLFLALGISIILMYVYLAWQFNSLGTPLIILVTIPLGLIGVLASLKLFGSVLNLNSLLGTILLGGVVVNNAIILIDFYENARDKHEDLLDALVHAAGIRLQPILITTLTTVIGMLPLAIGIGSGSDILKPLGIAVSGGLAVSTLLTLFAVPAIIRLGIRGKHSGISDKKQAVAPIA
jgi:hydrophobic/amphiphilic exporter-1 (mainly G- bacteria), HAE1 family